MLERRRGVSLVVKFAYALVPFALDFTSALWVMFGASFLTNTAVLDPDKAAWVRNVSFFLAVFVTGGLVFLLNPRRNFTSCKMRAEGLFRVLAAINHPLVLLLSDRTQSILGRRRIWLAMAAIPYGVFFFLLWVIPVRTSSYTYSQWLMLLYYAAIRVVANLLYSSIYIPHIALMNEMTPDYSERFTLQSMRVIASVMGQLASFGCMALLAKYLNSSFTGWTESECEKVRFLVIGAFSAVLVIVCVTIFVLMTREYRGVLPIIEQQRLASPREAKVIILEALNGVKKIMGVHAYLITVLQYCTALGAFQITLTMIPYYFGSYKAQSLQEICTLLFIVFGSGIVSAVLFIFLMRWFEKKTLYVFGSLVWFAFYIVVLFDTRNNNLNPIAILFGVGGATAIALPVSLLADSAHHVQAETRQRHEALILGTADTLAQAILGLMIFILLLVLSAMGYQNTDVLRDRYQQPEFALKGLKYLFCFMPAFLLVISLILSFFNPVTRAIQQRVLQTLRLRRLEERRRVYNLTASEEEEEEEEDDESFMADDDPISLVNIPPATNSLARYLVSDASDHHRRAPRRHSLPDEASVQRLRQLATSQTLSSSSSNSSAPETLNTPSPAAPTFPIRRAFDGTSAMKSKLLNADKFPGKMRSMPDLPELGEDNDWTDLSTLSSPPPRQGKLLPDSPPPRISISLPSSPEKGYRNSQDAEPTSLDGSIIFGSDAEDEASLSVDPFDGESSLISIQEDDELPSDSFDDGDSDSGSRPLKLDFSERNGGQPTAAIPEEAEEEEEEEDDYYSGSDGEEVPLQRGSRR